MKKINFLLLIIIAVICVCLSSCVTVDPYHAPHHHPHYTEYYRATLHDHHADDKNKLNDLTFINTKNLVISK